MFNRFTGIRNKSIIKTYEDRKTRNLSFHHFLMKYQKDSILKCVCHLWKFLVVQALKRHLLDHQTQMGLLRDKDRHCRQKTLALFASFCGCNVNLSTQKQLHFIKALEKIKACLKINIFWKIKVEW